MMFWIWSRLLRRLQSKCTHDPRMVAADILEGDEPGLRIEWCRCCGSYRIHFRFRSMSAGIEHGLREWREPRPDWETHK